MKSRRGSIQTDDPRPGWSRAALTTRAACREFDALRRGPEPLPEPKRRVPMSYLGAQRVIRCDPKQKACPFRDKVRSLHPEGRR